MIAIGSSTKLATQARRESIIFSLLHCRADAASRLQDAGAVTEDEVTYTRVSTAASGCLSGLRTERVRGVRGWPWRQVVSWVTQFNLGGSGKDSKKKKEEEERNGRLDRERERARHVLLVSLSREGVAVR